MNKIVNKFNGLRGITVVVSALILLVVWLYPVVASAADAAPVVTSSGVSDLMMMLLKLVATIVGLLVTWATTKAVAYFEKKTHIAVTASTETALSEWANKAVAYAYEKAHQKIQDGGTALKGPEKLDIALKFVNSLITEYKLPEQAEAKLTSYIESALGTMRKDNTVSVPDNT